MRMDAHPIAGRGGLAVSERPFTYLVGGKAGEGIKKAGAVASGLFASMGRRVFVMEDYPSLIRGGHNFSVVSTSVDEVTSHYGQADLLVALDRRTLEAHPDDLASGGLLVYNSDAVGSGDGIGVPMTTEAKKYPNPELRVGVSGAAALAAAIGLSREELSDLIARGYGHDVENNVAFATTVHAIVADRGGGRFTLDEGDRERTMLTGNQAIALGAAAAGLDIYIAYPMTPASTILHFLAAHDRDLGVVAMHPESELAAANIAIGAAAMGARAMVGTSGGGFALMEEAFSLAGMAEAPLVCVLGSRCGPSTGVPTYTEQADLYFALHQGHGEFPRIVASPGSVEEAYRLASELMSLAWRFQTPVILLTEKHLAESTMTVDLDPEEAAWAAPVMHEGGEYLRYRDTGDGVSPLLFPPSPELIKWSSYEHTEIGFTTERAAEIAAMHDKRNRKGSAIIEALAEMRTVNRYGEGSPLILTYGSTTLSVREAVRFGGIDATVVQPIYLEPLPVWELDRCRGCEAIVVEQSATGQFARLMRERAGVNVIGAITRYDGRPFEPAALAGRIKEAVSGPGRSTT
jgi:2-oxoglutarate ferredoxin oxidoreductase subunit alpha